MVKKKRSAAQEKPASKRPPGHPEHEPTPWTRKMVGALAFEGSTQARIAAHIDIDEKTLRKHYRRELDHETEKICALVRSARTIG